MGPSPAIGVAARLLVISLPVVTGRSAFYGSVEEYFRASGEIGLALSIAFVGLMVGFEVASMQRLRGLSGRQSATVGWFWLLVVVPLGAVAYYRWDFMFVLLATLVIERLFRGHRGSGAVFATAGAAIWPIVFAVPLLLQRRYEAVVTLAVSTAAVLTGWYLFSPEGFIRYWNPKGTTPSLSMAATVILFLGVGLIVAWGWRRPVNLVAVSGALMVALVLAVEAVPTQHVIWAAPLCALLFPRYRLQGYLFSALAVLVLLGLALPAPMTDGAWRSSFSLLEIVLLVGLIVELLRVATKGPVSLSEGR